MDRQPTVADGPALYGHCLDDSGRLPEALVQEVCDPGPGPVEPELVRSRYRVPAGTLGASPAAKRARDFLEANLCRPVDAAEICEEVGVPLRTLHHAFKNAFETSPIKYHSVMRLAKAHADLKRATPRSTTVTEIALDWGFWHFGRFSVAYKALFGESPSKTLGRNRRL